MAGTQHEWVEGRSILFDDSFLHEVWNNCSTHRTVLQVVLQHPDADTLSKPADAVSDSMAAGGTSDGGATTMKHTDL